MKRLFTLCLCMASYVTALFAQQTIAVLTHEGNSQFFHGINALVSAHEAAVDGDEIILSSGNFNAPEEITKAVRICGAGFRNDAYFMPTRVVGNININIPTPNNGRLHLLGIINTSSIRNHSRLSNALFEKCFFSGVFSSVDSCVIEPTFMHCFVRDSIVAPPNSHITMLNSVIKEPCTSSNGGFGFLNCVLIKRYFAELENSDLMNCLLTFERQSDSRHSSLPFTTTAYYCVSTYVSGIGGYMIFDNQVNNTNDYRELFQWGYCSVVPEDNFEISLDVVGSGNDGTILGIYGGINPFTYIPSSRRVINYEVANEATSDDKVNIKVTMK